MDESDDQLNGLRVRQLAALRRATYRSRSHAIIAAGVCLVAGVQLGIMGVHALRGESALHAFGYLAGAVLAFAATLHFVKRARQLHQDVRRMKSPEPSAPPDFTTLGGGSDLADRLNRIE